MEPQEATQWWDPHPNSRGLLGRMDALTLNF